MVTCSLAGYLGNQMFRIAATIGYAIKHNMNYIIPAKSVAPKTFPSYFPNLVTETQHHQDAGVIYDYNEKSFLYQEIGFYPNIRLNGLFQTEKYFIHCKKRIQNLFFNPVDPIKDTVAVCVRRGDYLQLASRHPVVSREYIQESINKFRLLGYNKFMFFSNDILWCREQFSGLYQDSELIYDQTNNPVQKMQLASACEHTIMSNSTFDWWVHYLNRNPDKLVALPPVWFGPDYQRKDLPYNFVGNPCFFDTSDLIPADWKTV